MLTIHERFVPTIKNIPKGLRRLFAQCLTKALAKVVWSNNVASWTELQMLPKCALCRPTRAGKSHKSQRLNWTRNRLLRWLAGERAQLWLDLPQYKQPKAKQTTDCCFYKIGTHQELNFLGVTKFLSKLCMLVLISNEILFSLRKL